MAEKHLYPTRFLNYSHLQTYLVNVSEWDVFGWLNPNETFFLYFDENIVDENLLHSENHIALLRGHIDDDWHFVSRDISGEVNMIVFIGVVSSMPSLYNALTNCSKTDNNDLYKKKT